MKKTYITPKASALALYTESLMETTSLPKSETTKPGGDALGNKRNEGDIWGNGNNIWNDPEE